MSNSLSGNDTVLFGPEPNPGDRLGNYILDRKLGSGGMGQVWKAIHEPTGKPYAIKLLPPIIASNPDAWDQVRRNFDIIENLNHPHICAVKVLDRDPKFGPYLVMAHVEGMTLSKFRQGRTFTPEQVAALLQPVAQALDFAHSRKVIHRDIKHENIMVVLADDGQTIVDTFVIDFGLAAQVRSTINRFSQQSVTAAGTRPYMAPEIWRSRPPVAASDQYALAVIAYEMLAGFFPFDGDDVAVLREAVLKDEVEAITGLPTIANKALLRGLAKVASNRLPSCCNSIATIMDTHLPQVPSISKLKSASVEDSSLERTGSIVVPQITTKEGATLKTRVAYTNVFAKTQEAMIYCNVKIDKIDITEGVVSGRTGASIKSWGQRVTSTIKRFGKEITVQISSTPVAQLIDWGRGKAEAEAVASTLFRLLQDAESGT